MKVGLIGTLNGKKRCTCHIKTRLMESLSSRIDRGNLGTTIIYHSFILYRLITCYNLNLLVLLGTKVIHNHHLENPSAMGSKASRKRAASSRKRIVEFMLLEASKIPVPRYSKWIATQDSRRSSNPKPSKNLFLSNTCADLRSAQFTQPFIPFNPLVEAGFPVFD